MFKSIYNIFKRIIISFFILYGYNMIINRFNLSIPINVYTIGFISIFGIPGFLGLVTFFILNFR